MELRNILFAGSLQYIVLALAVAFALAVLIVRSRKNKLRLFFFFLLSCAFYNFILYFGILFFLLAFTVFGFYLVLYLYSVQREKYYYADLSSCEEDRRPKRKIGILLRLVFPVLLCLGIAAPFMILSREYFSLLVEPSTPAVISFSSMALELFNSFNVHFLVIVTAIFMILLWMIIMAENSKENNR